MVLSSEAKLALGVGVGIGALWFILTRKGVASSVAAATTQAAVGAVTGAGAGAVQGVGLAVGVPLTDAQQCEIACAAGKTWDASFYCSAGRFAQYVTSGK